MFSISQLIFNLFLLFSFLSVSLWLHRRIDALVPEPFMDEPFHVDQVKHYCRNDFGYWNQKITTPPGLYLVSYGVLHLASLFTSIPVVALCNLSVLRLLNVGLAGVLYVTMVALLRSMRATDADKEGDRLAVTALNACLLPIVYFFTFLYYTDILSLLFVLVMYLLMRWKRMSVSAIFGALACLTRQTNIVWCAFCCSVALVEDFSARLSSRLCFRREPLATGDLLKMIHSVNLKTLAVAFLGSVMELVWFLALGVAFIGFLYFNHGIVLGDRTAHQPCFHAVQLCYCVAFLVLFACPLLTSPRLFRGFLWHVRIHPWLYVAACSFLTLVISAFTFEHPYLLADNRHLTFYLWRRWFKSHFLSKYLLIPLYLYGFRVVWTSLTRRGPFWRLAFVVATALVTVPNRLLEFRYFVIPYVFWRLHIPLVSRTLLACELVFYACVNAAAICLFLFKSFKWEGSDATQRIMF